MYDNFPARNICADDLWVNVFQLQDVEKFGT
jgi:hypothetical protein